MATIVKKQVYQMQAVIVTSQYPNLYHFLTVLSEKGYEQASEPIYFDRSQNRQGIVVWSPNEKCHLLDTFDKVELVEKYAQTSDVKVVLSAAANSQLREWGCKSAGMYCGKFPVSITQ